MVLKFYIEPYGENNWTQQIVKNIPHIETSVEECNFIVSSKIPYGTINPSLIQEVLLSYKDVNKRVIIFLLSDYNEPFDVPQNVIFFRSGMYKSKRKSNEHLIPYIWVKGELKGQTSLHPLQKRTIKPIIGFCGSISSHPCRIPHINKIKMSPDIKTNFILRADYWAGKPHDSGVVNDFIKNIENSHFTLCSRGAGNWSARFYQVLYLGRIPVVVNTDLVLPFEDKINWRDNIVLCDTEHTLSQNIKQYWNTRDIVSSQINCKNIYDNYLSPEKWCKSLADDILIPLTLNQI